MTGEAEAYLKREVKRAETALRLAGSALCAGDGSSFREYLRRFVLHRFAVYDEAAPGEERIDELAELSIRHTLCLTDGDLQAAGVITGCGASTTPVYKKIQLLFALQKAFSITFDPQRTPYILTLDELATEILSLHGSGAAPNALTVTAIVPDEEKALRIRGDFPILAAGTDNFNYLDNAATMQVPLKVRQVVDELYSAAYAGVHRGIHNLGNRATKTYEEARAAVAAHFGVSEKEIIFTSGATSSINMVAKSLGNCVTARERIVVTQMEHHSNYLPWLEVCRKTGAEFCVVPINPLGELNINTLQALIKPPTKLLAFTHCSNVLGTINPVEKICALAKEAGVLTMVDGAQGVRHESLDLHRIGCDFYAFSGHKIMAGSGVGVLYGREKLLNELPPPATGGGMVKRLRGLDICYDASPQRWEAGTPNLAGAVSLAAALRYAQELGPEWIHDREIAQLEALDRKLRNISGVTVLGKPTHRGGCLSFTVENLSSQDVAAALNLKGIALRAGHHCAIPLHEALGLEASVRISPAFYNTSAELQRFVLALREVAEYRPRYSLSSRPFS